MAKFCSASKHGEVALQGLTTRAGKCAGKCAVKCVSQHALKQTQKHNFKNALGMEVAAPDETSNQRLKGTP